jgi:hypothetical protein
MKTKLIILAGRATFLTESVTAQIARNNVPVFKGRRIILTPVQEQSILSPGIKFHHGFQNRFTPEVMAEAPGWQPTAPGKLPGPTRIKELPDFHEG